MGNRTIKRTAVFVIVVMGVVLIAVMAYGAYRLLQRAHYGLALEEVLHGNPTPERLLQYLSYNEPMVVSNALTTLEFRRDPIGITRAIELLENPDHYIWGPACMYLGAMNVRESIPFLIKGLRHPAGGCYNRIARYLRDLTGESFGKDQELWIKWWQQKNPGKSFNFAIKDT